MPYHRIEDPAKLRRLLQAVLMIESDLDLDDLLRDVVEEACRLAGARYGALGVLNERRTGFERFLTVGFDEETERAIGSRPTGRGLLGLLLTTPEPIRVADIAEHPDRCGFPPNHPPMTSFLGVPVRVRGDVYGNLYLTEKEGGSEFTAEDEAMVSALALAAGIAVENRRLHEQVRLVGLLEDRDRIARDLHDSVIQRIFAVGMSLHGASRIAGPPELVERVERAVVELDVVIEQLRTAIFDLEGMPGQDGLRRGVLDIAAELTPLLGCRPDISFHGPVDSGVPRAVADNVLAVLREALTNVGKHASASRVSVSLTIDDELCLEVADDGTGLPDEVAGDGSLGLNNLRNRAERLGGTLELGRAERLGGALVAWRVPI